MPGGQEERIMNLRFADDVLLIATSREHLQSMLEDLVRFTEEVGLEMHMGKTKILTSECTTTDADRPRFMTVRQQNIEIMPVDGSTMYLGRLLSIQNPHDVEIAHRLKRAWAKFMSYKKELCGKHYPLRDRLKLFNATVTPTVLYGCGCWTMTKEREKKLRTAQRKMLRWIVGVGRKQKTGSNSSGRRERRRRTPGTTGR